MLALALCLPLGSLGCGGDDCDTLREKLTAAMADLGSCETDADCEVIGGAPFQTCNCSESILSCGGDGIAHNAPHLATAKALIDEMNGGKCAIGCSNDCAPSKPVCLVNQHRCFGEIRSCNFVPLPDAAIDAPLATGSPADS